MQTPSVKADLRLIATLCSVGEEASFSLEEKLRRERQRQLHTGVTSYAWGSSGEVIFVPIANDLSIQVWSSSDPKTRCL